MKTPTITELKPDQELFEPNRFRTLVKQEGSLVKAVKKTIQQGDSVLTQRFLNLENIKMIIRHRAWLVDQVLQQLWNTLQCGQSSHIALLAVGGYGRGELHPHSDVDLLILIRDEQPERYHEELKSFIAQLWDIGVEIGHSVRTLSECVEAAKSDITIATNIMEARTVAGEDNLCKEMLIKTGPDHLWSNPDFFRAKWKEQIARHNKCGDTEYNLEPDIKNAPGGLRDIQTIGWVAKRYFNANRLSELITAGFLTEDEYGILNAGHSYLWEVRYALHLITQRSDNRLLFDHQRAVAKMLGYRDTDANLAVEKLMKRYYRVALSVSQLNDMLLQHFDEAILRTSDVETIEPFNKRFRIYNGFIEAVDDKVFERNPSALLEIFVILAQNENIEGIRASTIRLIRDNRTLIDQKFRDDIGNVSLFMELLRSQHKLYTQLWRMKCYGILGQYIPRFGQVIGQMQYDLFHVYTVDAHTLLLLKNIRRFRHPEAKKEFPVAAYIFHHLPKIELLYLAGLFHDVGKGKGGDHSELGASEAYAFCQHHRLGKWDCELVSWLVKNHLLMSMTAQKKDVSDPLVIQDFAKLVGDQVRLSYLYALTVADICATNPKLWNGWRSSLMRQLYTETVRALRRGLENPINKQNWIDDTKERARMVLENRLVTAEKIDQIWNQLGDDYFLRESYGDIAWQTEAITNHPDQDGPLVVFGEINERKYQGATQVFIYTRDTPNLFAATVAALNQLNLTILNARIITSKSNFSLDTYLVMEENGNPIGDSPDRFHQIKTKLETVLSEPDQFPNLVHIRTPRVLKHFNVPTQVVISNELNNQLTAVEVITRDRPGLLAEVGKIFLDMNIYIHNARIATLGEKVDDIFFVSDQNGNAISDPDLCTRLEQELIKHLDHPSLP